MSKFLKLKQENARVLIAADTVAAVYEGKDGSTILLKGTGEEINVKESYQTVVNRLTKGDDEASA